MSQENLYDFVVKDAAGKDVALADYRGKPMLIVNVASKCGFTPQYDGLEKLNQEFGPKGLVILGFPCNQFLGQEPGSDAEIQSFCRMNYGVTFPVMGKVEVNGKDTAPLFDYLKRQAPGFLGIKAVKWNFTKFLVDRNGKVVKRFAPKLEPAELAAPIAQLI